MAENDGARAAQPARVRRLTEADRPELEGFLARHAESSMFLRNNLQRAGMDYGGRDFEAEYHGAAHASGAIAGVIAHCWNGSVLVQAPEPHSLSALCASLRDAATRPCAGVLGPAAQADAVITAFALPRAAFALFADDTLFALELDALRVPPAPAANIRRTGPADAALLTEWLRDYEQEAIGREPGSELDALVSARVAQIQSGGDCWLLEHAGAPVCLSGFNARLPDVVQVGPVWTPAPHRGRGFARLLVALTLQEARASGVRKAILFTNNPPAIKAYEALGFRPCGAYRLALLKTPLALPSLRSRA